MATDSMTSKTSRGRLSESGPLLAVGGGVTARLVEVRALLLLPGDDFGGALDVVLASGFSLPTDDSDGFSLTERFVWTACPSAFFRSEGFFGDGMTGILQESPTVGKYVSSEIAARTESALRRGAVFAGLRA